MSVRRIIRNTDEEDAPTSIDQNVDYSPSYFDFIKDFTLPTLKKLPGFAFDAAKGTAETTYNVLQGVGSLFPTGNFGIPEEMIEPFETRKQETREKTLTFIKKTGTSALNQVASSLDMIGDYAFNHPEILLPFLTSSNLRGGLVANTWKDFYNGLDERGIVPSEAAKQFTQELDLTVSIEPTQEWQDATLEEKVTELLPETMFQLGPGIISSLGLFAINPTVGLVAAGGSVANEVKESAIDYGVDRDTAELLGLTAGIAISYFEKIVPNRLFGPGAKKTFVNGYTKRLVETGFLESGTEFTQEGIQLAIESTFREDLGWDEAKTRLAFAYLGGLFGGVGAQGTVDFVNNIRTGSLPVNFGFTIQETGEPSKKPTQPKKTTATAQPELSLDGASLEEVDSQIEEQIETFRREADLMADRSGAGVRLRPVEDARGEVDFVATDFSLNRAKANMARQKKDLQQFAKELLYENDVAFRQLIDLRDSLLEQQIDQAESVEKLQIPFLEETINDLKTKSEAYADITLDPRALEATRDAKAESIIKAREALKQAQKINRPARINETKRSVRRITQQEPSKMIKRRESTLLKDKIRNIARGVREGSFTTKRQVKAVQTELLRILDKSELSPKDRDKFRKTIKNVQTPDQLRRILPKFQERVTSLESKEIVRTLRKKIEKELKATKTKRVNGKPVGKFTPEIQNVLDKLREAFSLTRAGAETKIISNIKRYPGGPPVEVALENMILSIASGDLSGAELQNLLDQIIEMKETGNMINSLKKFNLQSKHEALRGLVVDRVTGGKGIQRGAATFGERKARFRKLKQSLKTLGKTWILPWAGQLRILERNNPAGEELLPKRFGTLKQDNAYKESQHEFNEDIKNAVANAYDIENKETKIHRKLGDLTQEVNLGKFKNLDGVEQELIMTKDEIIKRWMELQDLTLREAFINGNRYTEKIVSAIEGSMTSKDRAFAQAQFDLYEKQWKKINPVYSKIYGVDLPFNEAYSPIRRKGFKVDTAKGLGEFLVESVDRRALTSSSFKLRVKNNLPIVTQGSISALERHITETNYFIAWGEKIREFNAIFGDTTVREVIEQQFGAPMNTALGNTIDDLTTNGNRSARNNKILDFMRKKFTVGALMLKPAVGIKQLVSTVAYLEKLSPKDFTLGVIDFWKNPIKNTRILNAESTFIKTRGSNMERDIKAAMDSDTFKRFTKSHNFVNTAMLNVRLGDKGAILTGSWAMRRARLKKGADLQDIIREYEEFGSETQQSSDISQLSQVQRGNSLELLFTMFKSSQRQYFAKELNAVASLFQEGGFKPKNIKKVARVLVIYHVMLPMTFQYIANLGGWDDEDKKEYLRAGILGSANGIFIFGDIIDGVVRKALGLRVWDTEIPIGDIGDDIQKAIGKLQAEDFSSEDFWSAIIELTSAGTALGLPTDQAKNVYLGIENIMEGETKAGIAEILGWSPYFAEEDKGKTSTKKSTSSGTTSSSKQPRGGSSVRRLNR